MKDSYSKGEKIAVLILLVIVIIFSAIHDGCSQPYDPLASHNIIEYCKDTLTETGKYTNLPYKKTVGEVNVRLEVGHSGYIKGKFSNGKTWGFQLDSAITYQPQRGHLAFTAIDDDGKYIYITIYYGYDKEGVLLWELQMWYPTYRHSVIFKDK